MGFSSQHPAKLCLTALLFFLCIVLAANYGELKPASDIDWMDILGEGSSLAVVLAWLLLVLYSRPAGPVTNGLYVGSLLLVISYQLNLLDEFFQYPESHRLLSWLESIPAPLGMLILTFGLIGWHKEQRFINQQLASRELHLRHYQLLDPLTKLYKPEYLLAVLKRELELQQQHHQPFCLALIDISQFGRFNREQGMAAADLLLQQLSELTLVQFRSGDLVCRYSGDKFVILMPQSNQAMAQSLVQNACRELNMHLHTELHWTVTEIPLTQQVTKPQRLLSQLWQQLQKQKQQQNRWSLV